MSVSLQAGKEEHSRQKDQGAQRCGYAKQRAQHVRNAINLVSSNEVKEEKQWALG